MDDPYASGKHPLREELENLKECWGELAAYTPIFAVVSTLEYIVRIAS